MEHVHKAYQEGKTMKDVFLTKNWALNSSKLHFQATYFIGVCPYYYDR